MRLLLSLLIVIACKPSVRQPISDLHAITDGKLMLGTVAAITRQGNHSVYRLLVCKNSIATEDRKVYSDTNSCRPALVSSSSGKEIVLFPNHLQRGFAAKWKGRLKRSAIGTMVAIPIIVAIPVAKKMSEPFYKYVTKTVKKGDTKVVSKLADSSDPLLASKGNEFYQQLHNLQTQELSKFIDSVEGRQLTQREMVGVMEIIKLHGHTLGSINQTSLISKLENQRQMLLDMKQTGQQFTNSPLSKQEDKFIDDFSDKYIEHENSFLDIEAILEGNKATPPQQGMIEMLPRMTKISKQLTDDMPRYYDLYVDKVLIGTDKTIDEAIDIVDKKLVESKTKYDRFALNRDEFAQDLRSEELTEVFKKSFDFNWLSRGVGFTAGTSVIVSLEESIWGHGDRLASRYWSKIFHDSYSLDRAITVKDLPDILRSLAKTFRCQVNDQALQLANH